MSAQTGHLCSQMDELAKRVGIQSTPPEGDGVPDTEREDCAARLRRAVGLLADLERAFSGVRQFLDEENARR